MAKKKINSTNRVYFKNSLKNDELSKMEKILHFLAGLVGILDAGLWFIVENNDNFPSEHPIIFGIGLGSLFLVLIAGFILSCIREYKVSPTYFMQTAKKILLILLFSIIFTVLLFSIFIFKLIN